MKVFAAAVVLILGIVSMPTLAQSGKADGDIRKVNKEASELTIKHGPFEGIDMGGMTMTFSVKDNAILDKVKIGDRVNFTVSMKGGEMVVTDVDVKKR
jgi:Cu(I)/Ag(I) efflux system periplasmic protein CusF